MTPQSPPVAEPPIDETKAPDPLPDVLPAGTKWKAGVTEGVFLETSGRLKNEGDGRRWGGHCEWFIGPNGDIRKGGRSVRGDFVDWPSYYAALRSPPAPPEADKRPLCAPARSGSVDAAHRETAVALPSGGAAANSTQPSEPGRPKPDPYAEHRDRVARNAAMQAKLDSARADLGRPMREKRYGRLGQLDCYGAKLSSVGWETED